MRSRPWILILALMISFTALIMYHAWTIFKANERIKSYLLSQIRPILGEDCNIEKLDIALGAVHLKGVSVISRNKYYSLWIEDLRIGYSIINLIRNGFKPAKSPQDILFINPELKVTYLSKETQHDENTTESTFNQKYLEKIRNFDFLKRITVSKGSVVYEDSLGVEIRLANDVSGWIVTKDIEKARARMVGKLFQSNRFNLRLNGEIDILKSKLSFVEINLVNYRWEEKIPLFIPEYFEIIDGRINGNLLITEKKMQQGFDILGDFSINDGSFKIRDKNLFVTDVNLDVEIKDWDFIINKSQQLLNGSEVIIEGKIKNILKPEFNLVIHSELFDIGMFQDYYLPKSKLRLIGNSALSLSILKSYEKPFLKGAIECSQLSINDEHLKNVKLQLQYQNSKLRLSSFSALFNGQSITSFGDIDFSGSDGLVSARLNLDGNIPPDFMLHSIANKKINIQTTIEGNLESFKGNAIVTQIQQSNDSLNFCLNNEIFFKDETLFFSTRSKSNSSVAKGSIAFKKKNIFSDIELINSHETFFQLPEFKGLRSILDFEKTKINIRSGKKTVDVSANYAWRNGKNIPPRTGELKVLVKNESSQKNISGSVFNKFGNHFYNGKFDVISNSDVFDLKNLTIDGILSANAVVDLKNNKKLNGKIVLSDAELNYLCNIFTSNSELINSGKIFGMMDISGTFDKPVVNGQLEFVNLFLNKIGIYSGKSDFNIIDNIFKINSLNLKKDDETILDMKGDYDFESKNVALNILGSNIDLNNLFMTFSERLNLIVGNAHANIDINGDISNPQINGEIIVGRGKFYKFHFDSIFIDLGKEHYVSNGVKEGVYIKDCLIKRKDEFDINASGIIPYTSDTNLDIDVIAQGDLLSILPELTSFVQGTDSEGKWEMRFTGSPGNFQIESGELSVKNGHLLLKDVAPEIKNIEAHVSFENDGFVNVEYMGGRIKEKYFQFTTERADSIECRRKLQPLTIPNLGLDFGVFTLETSPKGIPLHIPGLMAKGETGFFEFAGKEDEEMFYVAGPVPYPEIRGEVRLRNVNVMYPFAETPGVKKDNLVLVILNHINWDVRAKPVKDARYEKEIPSGVDNVYVNLFVDSGVGALDFNGIIIDQSFYIEGFLESTEGIVDYLDFNFNVEKAGIEFDKSSFYPIAYGSAKAIIADSTGMRSFLYLTLLLEDKDSGEIRTKGRLDNIRFQLSTDNPNIGRSEAEIMASLGYSAENIKEKATDILGISTDNLLFRPLFRPFERKLERVLNLDMVRVRSRFAKNLIEMNLRDEEIENQYSKLFLLRSTRLTVGKYLADNVFLQYTGQLESGLSYRHQEGELGLKHSFGLEYRINPTLQLEMEYNYNSFLLQQEDKRIFLRHSFPIN